MSSLILFIFTSFLFVGFSSKGYTAPLNSQPSLSKTVEEIYSDKNLEKFTSCDFKNLAQIKTIARELDKRQKEIQEFIPTHYESGPFKEHHLDDFFFIELTSKYLNSTEWQYLGISWHTIIDFYNRVRHTPTNKTWFTLNGLFRTIILDDADRLIHGINQNIKPNDKHILSDIIDLLIACSKNDFCFEPTLSSLHLKFLSHGYSELVLLNGIYNPSTSKNEKRSLILKLIFNLEKYNHWFFKVNLNPSVTYQNKTLMVPLHTPQLDQRSRAYLVKLIEQKWSNSEYSLKILGSNATSSAYTLNIGPSIGGRAYVDHDIRLLQVYNGGYLNSLFHEIGHVLGLPDNYFTNWNNDLCSYDRLSLPSDIMSDSSNGEILLNHWEALERAYNESPSE